MHQSADEGSCGEGNTCRYEPSTDYGEHSRYSEHGAVAAPCVVGERRTHCHHEGYVGRRERQLVVGTDDDEHGGKHKVDGCAHLVEGSSVGKYCLFFVEAGVNPFSR